MPQATSDVSVEEIRALIWQLSAREISALADVIDERAETVAMMKLAETSFREWNKEGEGIYDAQTY